MVESYYYSYAFLYKFSELFGICGLYESGNYIITMLCISFNKSFLSLYIRFVLTF